MIVKKEDIVEKEDIVKKEEIVKKRSERNGCCGEEEW